MEWWLHAPRRTALGPWLRMWAAARPAGPTDSRAMNLIQDALYIDDHTVGLDMASGVKRE